MLRHFWIVLVVVNLVNGHAWWNRAQSRIQTHPELEAEYRRLYRGVLFWTNLPRLFMGVGIVSGDASRRCSTS